MAVFEPYPSISNKTRYMQEWVTEAVPAGTVWVATPKFHGVNMSVTVHRGADGLHWAVGRRNGFLQPTDKFYSWQEVLQGYPWLRLLTHGFPSAEKVVVYGELYGGLYGSTYTTPVQRTVQYDDRVAFVGFDVCVDGHFF